MSRRLCAVGLAAVLAAGPALAVPAPALAATKPGYVAVTISGHGTHCVKWTKGITGDTILNKVATVAYRNDGLIVQIDGDPTSGTADASHFWSYWHDTNGTWAYSSYGASSTHPAAGTVEGWSYDNGKSSPPKPSQDPSGLYATLCGAKDASTGTGSGGGFSLPTTSSPAAARTSSASTHGTRRTTTVHHASVSRTATPTSSHATSAPASSRTSAASSSRAASPVHPSASPSSSASAPATIDASPASAASSSSSHSPVGLLVGIGLVVILGVGAGAVALRRRSAGS